MTAGRLLNRAWGTPVPHARSTTGKDILMDETTFLNVLQMTVENHGCRIVDLDLDRRMINLDGPDEAVDACFRAIADLVGE
ncbi:uncharacterized protein Dvar_70610 [Desulfosarcina variabilis str. Montpellier]